MSKPNKAELLARMQGAQPEVDGVLPIHPTATKALPNTKRAPRPAKPAVSDSGTPPRRLTAQLNGETWDVLDALPRTVSAAAFIRAAVATVASDAALMVAALDTAEADAGAARRRS